MFMLQCAYEENCLASASSQTPATSYRRLLRFSSQIHNNGQSDFRPKADRHSWVWHDCHRWDVREPTGTSRSPFVFFRSCRPSTISCKNTHSVPI